MMICMTLPENKTDFPKCLYLDQNKWIDLARAHYDREGGEDFKPALAAVRDAVAKTRIVVPISGVHVMETMAPKDDGRRRLAEFMVDVSANNAILPHMAIRGLEVLHAVVRKLGLAPTTSIRPAIIRPGLSFALGAEPVVTAPEAIKKELLDLMNSRETSVRILCEAGDRAVVETIQAEDVAVLKALEETRQRALAELSDEMRHRVELVDLFTKGEPATELHAALKSLGIGIKAFADKFTSPEDWMAFFHDVPTVDVFVTLGLTRDKELSRKIHRNDLKDMAFLSVAVPYANIIVVENFWGSVVQRTKLDSKHKTIISTDARQLPEILGREGCL